MTVKLKFSEPSPIQQTEGEVMDKSGKKPQLSNRLLDEAKVLEIMQAYGVDPELFWALYNEAEDSPVLQFAAAFDLRKKS